MTSELVINASIMGSMARFNNLSCDPNCETEKWNVGSELRSRGGYVQLSATVFRRGEGVEGAVHVRHQELHGKL